MVLMSFYSWQYFDPFYLTMPCKLAPSSCTNRTFTMVSNSCLCSIMRYVNIINRSASLTLATYGPLLRVSCLIIHISLSFSFVFPPRAYCVYCKCNVIYISYIPRYIWQCREARWHLHVVACGRFWFNPPGGTVSAGRIGGTGCRHCSPGQHQDHFGLGLTLTYCFLILYYVH